MEFKIATWNVNSIRVRSQQVQDWLEKEDPDILAIQETKTQDPDFPKTAFEEMGYHVHYSGEKTYNGVAMFSKHEPKDILTDFPTFNDPARRLLVATIDDIHILNIYAPNGSEVGSEKYIYKLHWLEHLYAYLLRRIKHYPKMIILGDFNIAPEDRDVYDPKAFEGHVLVSPPERRVLKRILQLGLTDTFRLFEHDPKNAFSWWDYRAGAFQKNNGLRLDLILASQALADHCSRCEIDKAPRKLPQPSDHAPVVAVFDL